MSGLLDGFYFDKIIFNGNVVFDYPFKQARLSEEEIAIAVGQLQFRSRDVVAAQTEVGHEEPLDVAFALDGVTDGGQLPVAVAHILQDTAPFSVEGQAVEPVLKFTNIHTAPPVVVLHEELVILHPDIVIG